MKLEIQEQAGGTPSHPDQVSGPPKKKLKSWALNCFSLWLLPVPSPCPRSRSPLPHSLCRGAPPRGGGPTFPHPLCTGPGHMMLVRLGVPDSPYAPPAEGTTEVGVPLIRQVGIQSWGGTPTWKPGSGGPRAGAPVKPGSLPAFKAKEVVVLISMEALCFSPTCLTHTSLLATLGAQTSSQTVELCLWMPPGPCKNLSDSEGSRTVGAGPARPLPRVYHLGQSG